MAFCFVASFWSRKVPISLNASIFPAFNYFSKSLKGEPEVSETGMELLHKKSGTCPNEQLLQIKKPTMIDQTFIFWTQAKEAKWYMHVMFF